MDSHHYLSARYSVINTLRHRAKTVCSSSPLLKEEEDHLNRALGNCRYPAWPLNRAKMTNMDNNKRKKNKTTYNMNRFYSTFLNLLAGWVVLTLA